MDLQGRLRHIAFRVEITMECFAGREPIEELDAADLHQAIPGERIEPGGFGIQDNFAHRCSSAGANHRLRIVATLCKMSRICARVCSKLCELSTTKSARPRFCASGICLARSVANFSSVMPGRSKARARWTSAGAETTTTASHCDSAVVSNNRGISTTTIVAPRACACARNFSREAVTSG